MKCVCMQYLEAVWKIKQAVADGDLPPPLRTLHLSYLPDEEIGGHDGALKFTESELWTELNVGLALDEGLANPEDKYTVFYGERAPWWVKFKAEGPTGHASRFIPRPAIEKLSAVINQALQYKQSQEALLHHEDGCKHANAKKLGDVVTLNITAVRAGVPGPEKYDGFSINCIPTEAIAAMDMRIPPSIPLEDMDNMLKEWTKEEGVSYQFYSKMSEHRVTALDDQWWACLKTSLGKLGKSVEPEIFPAATDSRYIRLRNTPCFGFSPMANTPILLHDHDEFLNEKVFLEGITVFQTVIYDFLTLLG